MLGEPYGKCGAIPLDYKRAYTFSACLQQCYMEDLVGHCSCRDAYMPHDTESGKLADILEFK